MIKLLHDITQLGYYVQFCDCFFGMIRIEYRKEFDVDYYEHAHLGYPGCKLEKLEEEVIKSMGEFLEKALKK